MLDYKYFGTHWSKSYKKVRVGRLYIEWWGHSMWHAGVSRNFYQFNAGRLAMAWARFKCL